MVPDQVPLLNAPFPAKPAKEIHGASNGGWAGVLAETGIKPGASRGPLTLRGPLGQPEGDGGIAQGEIQCGERPALGTIRKGRIETE